MKKFTLALTLLLVSLSAHAQLLWKISGGGLSKPSYVVGTYHLAPASFADSISGLQAALDAAEQVYGELDITQMTDPTQVMVLQKAMLLPEGKKLSTLLTADEMKRLNAYMKDLLGADLTNPMLASQMEKLSPAALSSQFQLVSFMKRTPGFDAQNLFDAYFQKVAKEKGKPVGGLENVEFQANTLYKGSSLERQVAQLMCQVDYKDFYDAQADELLAAFFGQDMQRLEKLMDAKRNDSCDSTPEEEDKLIFLRNENWAKALPAIMKAKSTFLAVGAAHLPGERGLLNLLRKGGYTVEAVK